MDLRDYSSEAHDVAFQNLARENIFFFLPSNLFEKRSRHNTRRIVDPSILLVPPNPFAMYSTSDPFRSSSPHILTSIPLFLLIYKPPDSVL